MSLNKLLTDKSCRNYNRININRLTDTLCFEYTKLFSRYRRIFSLIVFSLNKLVIYILWVSDNKCNI